jgi:hypothetical protein
MVKKNTTNYSYFFLFVIIIFLVPGVLHADLPGPLGFIDLLVTMVPLVLLLLPITVFVFPTLVKVWVLKRKLSMPWKFKTIEKLSLGALAETIAEFIFLNLTIWLFKPAVNDVLNIEAASTTPKDINVLLHAAIVIPWYCIMGTISMLILINFLTTLDKQEISRQYLKTSALLSLILPVIIILIITVRILLFK